MPCPYNVHGAALWGNDSEIALSLHDTFRHHPQKTGTAFRMQFPLNPYSFPFPCSGSCTTSRMTNQNVEPSPNLLLTP